MTVFTNQKDVDECLFNAKKWSMSKINIATLEKVVDIKCHPRANNLQFVYLTNDLFGITSKDEYDIGDQVIYIRKGARIITDGITENCRSYLKHIKDYFGYVDSVKLHGYVSPGLIVNDELEYDFPVGTEVSYLIGITRYRGRHSFNKHVVKRLATHYYEYQIDRNFPFDTVTDELIRENVVLEKKLVKLLQENIVFEKKLVHMVNSVDICFLAFYIVSMLSFWAYYEFNNHLC